jgi:hypothetical protein
MKIISSVGVYKACSPHSGHRGQAVFPMRAGNQNFFRQLVGSIPIGDNQAKYRKVRVETLLPNQPMELSHWSAMLENNSPVLIEGM